MTHTTANATYRAEEERREDRREERRVSYQEVWTMVQVLV
jgi:hypothetical protein